MTKIIDLFNRNISIMHTSASDGRARHRAYIHLSTFCRGVTSAFVHALGPGALRSIHNNKEIAVVLVWLTNENYIFLNYIVITYYLANTYST